MPIMTPATPRRSSLLNPRIQEKVLPILRCRTDETEPASFRKYNEYFLRPKHFSPCLCHPGFQIQRQQRVSFPHLSIYEGVILRSIFLNHLYIFWAHIVKASSKILLQFLTDTYGCLYFCAENHYTPLPYRCNALSQNTSSLHL